MAWTAQTEQVRHIVGATPRQRHNVVSLPVAYAQFDSTTPTAASLPFERVLAVLRIGRILVGLPVRVSGVALCLIDRRLVHRAVVALGRSRTDQARTKPSATNFVDWATCSTVRGTGTTHSAGLSADHSESASLRCFSLRAEVKAR